MKKTFKKIAASVMAAATLAVGSVGMTASAYSPTVTRSFDFDGATVTGTHYRDSSGALGTTKATKRFYRIAVSVSWGTGDSAYGYSDGGNYASAKKVSGSGTSRSNHYAYKSESSSAHTSITY